jgi:hypothetical protein
VHIVLVVFLFEVKIIVNDLADPCPVTMENKAVDSDISVVFDAQGLDQARLGA